MLHILLSKPALGAIYLFLSFLICLFLVAIGKIVLLYFKSQRQTPVEKKEEPLPEVKQPVKRRVKTITIDPDDVTKICFKKSN